MGKRVGWWAADLLVSLGYSTATGGQELAIATAQASVFTPHILSSFKDGAPL